MSNDTLHEKLAAQEDQLREMEEVNAALLDAARLVLKWHGWRGGCDDELADPQPFLEMRALQLAIAKAEGKA